MKEQVLQIMSKVFEININDLPSVVDQNHIDNWDSLRHLNLILELEEIYQVSYEPEEISDMISLEKIIDITNTKI